MNFKDYYYLQFSNQYRIFIESIKNTSPENWYQDGERIFTKKEKYFLEIYNKSEIVQNKKRELNKFSTQIIDSDFSFSRILNAPNFNVIFHILNFELMSKKEKFNAYKFLLNSNPKNCDEAYKVDCKLRILIRKYWW